MQDPVKTIKELLYDNWFDDDSELDRDDIAWRFGPPDNPMNRFNDHEMSFEFDSMTGMRRKRTLARSQAKRIVTIDFWKSMSIEDDREDLKTLIQSMVDRVDVIVTANERAATDLDLIYVGAGPRSLDRVDEGYVRTQLEMVCVHQK